MSAESALSKAPRPAAVFWRYWTGSMPGYSVLLTDDEGVGTLTALDWRRRGEFLLEMSLLGEVIEGASILATANFVRVSTPS